MIGKTATTADDVGRIRVLTIAITAPQHEQSIGGRSLRGGLKRFGSNFGKTVLRQEMSGLSLCLRSSHE